MTTSMEIKPGKKGGPFVVGTSSYQYNEVLLVVLFIVTSEE